MTRTLTELTVKQRSLLAMDQRLWTGTAQGQVGEREELALLSQTVIILIPSTQHALQLYIKREWLEPK